MNCKLNYRPTNYKAIFLFIVSLFTDLCISTANDRKEKKNCSTSSKVLISKWNREKSSFFSSNFPSFHIFVPSIVCIPVLLLLLLCFFLLLCVLRIHSGSLFVEMLDFSMVVIVHVFLLSYATMSIMEADNLAHTGIYVVSMRTLTLLCARCTVNETH